MQPNYSYYAKLACLKPRFWVCGQVEVTNACLQKCRYCESRTDPNAQGCMSLGDFQDLCSILAEKGLEHLSLTGGDPQAWPFLDIALQWFEEQGLPFDLQVNTALAGPFEDWALWRRVFSDVRLSLDAVDPELYREMRGVAMPSLTEKLQALAHPRLATITTVSELNLEHIPRILEWLAELVCSGVSIRKAIFLPAMGVEHSPAFWERWSEIAKAYADQARQPVLTSFAESALKTRLFLQSQDSSQVPCYAGNLTFHMKPNGDVYPCCLAGGEAVQTDVRFRLGRWPETDLQELFDSYQPRLCYADPQLPCRDICQWKQTNINVAAHKASQMRLSIP